VLWRVSEIAGGAAEAPDPRERRAHARSGKRPAAPAKRLGTRPLELPWLCFESRTERRRVSPAPGEWEEMTDQELEDLMGTSQLL
jgi:hypothetical protein